MTATVSRPTPPAPRRAPARSSARASALYALAALAAAAALPAPAGAAAVFVNELHYDNAGADQDELVELAGPAGTDLAGWQLVLYNGASGTPYQTTALDGVIPDAQHGIGALAFALSGVQNGPPDGLALVTADGTVVQLLSYEGTFTALDGPAAGLHSTDIGAAEAGTEALGQSLQLGGTGREADHFSWLGPLPASPGALNAAQLIAPAPVALPASLSAMIGALALLGLTAIRRRQRSRPERGSDRAGVLHCTNAWSRMPTRDLTALSK